MIFGIAALLVVLVIIVATCAPKEHSIEDTAPPGIERDRG